MQGSLSSKFIGAVGWRRGILNPSSKRGKRQTRLVVVYLYQLLPQAIIPSKHPRNLLLTTIASPATFPNENQQSDSRSYCKSLPTWSSTTPFKSSTTRQLRRPLTTVKPSHLPNAKRLGRQDASSNVTTVPYPPLSHEHQIFTNATS